MVHRTLDGKERLAQRVVDPVVGGATQAQTLPCDVAAGQLRLLAVIQSHVAVDIQRAGQFRTLFHPVFRQHASPTLRSFVLAELGQFLPQATHFGNAVQAHQLAEFPGRLILELFHRLDAAQGHVGQQQDHVQRHVVAREHRQGFQMAKQPVLGQGRQSTEHTAVGNVSTGLKLRRRAAGQQSDGRHDAFAGTGAGDSHLVASGGIGIAARRLVGRRDGRAGSRRRQGNLLGRHESRLLDASLVDRFAKRVVFDAQFFGDFAIGCDRGSVVSPLGR